MDKAQAVNQIEANLPQEKIHFIERSRILEEASLDNKNKDERKQLTELAPLRVFLARKNAVKEVKYVNEIICYLKYRYLPTMKSKELLLKIFQVRKINLNSKRYLAP